MKVFISIFILSLLLVAQVVGVELITNGDFESNSEGWEEQSSGTGTISFGNYDPNDPDMEVQAYKYSNAGYKSLNQVVWAPALDISFSFSTAFWNSCENNTYNYYAASAIILYYLKEDETILGETRIYSATQYCPWQNTNTIHLYPVNDTLWHDYSFNITDELTYLPGVAQDSIKKLKVSIYAFTTTHC